MSLDAKRAWDDNPILTTVSTTALPIHELEYPAITICGQGMASETLDKVQKSKSSNNYSFNCLAGAEAEV